MGGMLRTGVVSSVRDYLKEMQSTLNIYTSNMGEDSLDFNLVDIYIDEMFKDCIQVSFENNERATYNKNPKKLSHAFWGTTDLYYIIMVMNDFKDFDDCDLNSRTYIYIPNKGAMEFLMDLTRKKLNGNLTSFIP